MVASAGSFAAISTLLGSPIVGAFLLMKASGLGGRNRHVHLPGLPMVAGVAMGIGAMSAVMLTLPLISVLLSALLLGADRLAVTPLVIVTVIVTYVAAARMTRTTGPHGRPGPAGRHGGRGGHSERERPGRGLRADRDSGAMATARAPVPAERVFAPD